MKIGKIKRLSSTFGDEREYQWPPGIQGEEVEASRGVEEIRGVGVRMAAEAQEWSSLIFDSVNFSPLVFTEKKKLLKNTRN